MIARINKAHFPVTTLGYGRRIGVWFQGCPIRCAGCTSMDTWEDDPGRAMPLKLLMRWCKGVTKGNLNGITISGGEPFHQPEALFQLVTELRKWENCLGEPIDILCYSGYHLSHLTKKFQETLALLDVLITGPFMSNRPSRSPLRGSSNQKLVALSPQGISRYSESAQSALTGRKQMQVKADGQGIWFIGVPQPGDMAHLKAHCEAQGLNMEETSWG